MVATHIWKSQDSESVLISFHNTKKNKQKLFLQFQKCSNFISQHTKNLCLQFLSWNHSKSVLILFHNTKKSSKSSVYHSKSVLILFHNTQKKFVYIFFSEIILKVFWFYFKTHKKRKKVCCVFWKCSKFISLHKKIIGLQFYIPPLLGWTG